MKFVLVPFFLALIGLSSTQGWKLHPQWCSFISDLCKRFEDNPGVSSQVHHHYEYSTDDPFLHLLPPVIIWAPVEQFKSAFPNGFLCPKCDTSSLLCGFDWMDGAGTERSMPRKIHGRDGVTILVGRIYKCKQLGHEVVGYHPGVLQQIKAPSLIPFRLWYIEQVLRVN